MLIDKKQKNSPQTLDWQPTPCYNDICPLGSRLVVGRQVLALVARVRVLPPQPLWPHRLVV